MNLLGIIVLLALAALGLHAAGVPWWAPALATLPLLALDLYLVHRRRQRLPPGVEVKEYPPGCSCIRGALLDNPQCPHHRDSGWT